MPKTTKGGKLKKSELPSALRRSDGKAKRTFAKTHDAAADEYGSEERAHRVAYSALEHSFEKVGRGRRCQREQEAPARPGAPARRARQVDHEQVRAGRRDQEGEPPGPGPLSGASFPSGEV